jgi:3-oxoacyl-[acyl-carrier-protein] synthase-3
MEPLMTTAAAGQPETAVPPACAAVPRAAVLCGLGAWTPPDVLTNEQLTEVLPVTDGWIRKRTGIAVRHVAAPGMATSELAAEAGQRALKSAGIETVDALVLATTTPDRPCPATAPQVASRLGLGTVAAFDVGAVCAGFVYALATAAGLVAAGIADTVLVIGAELLTGVLNPRDHATRVIFGDGAGAVVVRAGRPDELGAIGSFALGSDGLDADLITIPAGGSQQPHRCGDGDESGRFLRMQGQHVYRRALEVMTESSRQALAAAGWPVSSVDWLVCHQANKRIVTAVAARLGVPADRCLINIEEVGNTSAASIPLALAHGADTGALGPGDRVVLTGFGGGLAWGSAVLRWPDIAGRG